jgi:hypothetical protein
VYSRVLTPLWAVALQFELAGAISTHVVRPLGARVQELEAQAKAIRAEQAQAERQLEAAAAVLRRAYAGVVGARREAARTAQTFDAARHNFKAKERELRSAGDDAARAGGEAQRLAGECERAEEGFARAQETHYLATVPRLAAMYQRVGAEAQAAIHAAIKELNNIDVQAASQLGEQALRLADLVARADTEAEADPGKAGHEVVDGAITPPAELSALAIMRPMARGHAWIAVATGNEQQTKLQTNVKAQHRLLILGGGGDMLYAYADDAWDKPDLVIDTGRLRNEDVFVVDPSLLARPFVFAVCAPDPRLAPV